MVYMEPERCAGKEKELFRIFNLFHFLLCLFPPLSYSMGLYRRILKND